MAEPARESAAAQDPAEPERPVPAALFWADARDAVTADSRTAALAAGELARDPGNGAALAMAGLLAAALESLAGITGRLADAEQGRMLDEAVIAARERQAYDRGAADCKAARCRLEVIDGGAPGPA